MHSWFNKLFAFSILVFLLSCGQEEKKEPFNLYGNSFRQSTFEQFGKFWTGVSLLEKVQCSDTTGFISHPLALSQNKFVTSTANGVVVCYEHTKLLWEFKLKPNEYVISNFIASPNEEIIFITNLKNVYSISKDGKENWNVTLDDTSRYFSNLLATANSFYFTNSFGLLYRINYKGIILFKKFLPLPSTNCFTEFKNNRIVLNLTHDEIGKTDTVLLVDTNGNFLWKQFFEGLRLVRYPVVWKDRIYVFGYKEQDGELLGMLSCLNENGKVIWNKEFGIVPRYLSISKDGNLYLVLYNSGLGETISTIYKIDTNGTIVNKQHITAVFNSPLFLSQQLIGALGYIKYNPVMIFFGEDLTLWKTIDLSKYPSVLNIPAILEDCTMFFVSTSGNFFVRIDENPVIKLLPW
ncbi:MAG: hypothetical protein CH6_3839 [Candidatus Kapaibacterium sp.]|nr:MAG: hypothetical protein CH6_3839 [Candidatus Kapabacteria bacterium]